MTNGDLCRDCGCDSVYAGFEERLVEASELTDAEVWVAKRQTRRKMQSSRVGGPM